MRFESFLSMRYIKSQKRHSALTICSIAIAVALMTIIFTAYSTYKGIMYDEASLNAPYHMAFCHITEEEADEIKNLKSIKSSDAMQNKDGTYTLSVYFKKKGMGDTLEFTQQLTNILNISDYKMNSSSRYVSIDGTMPSLEKIDKFTIIWNDKLIYYDLVTDSAVYATLSTICLLFIGAVIFALMLRFIIDTAFEISSKEREKQFGILQSVGAEPKQIVRIITFEGIFLSVIGVPIGLLLGIGITFSAFCFLISSGNLDVFFTAETAEKVLHFHINPLMLLISALTGLGWVLLSAYGTGMRIIKMSPVEAISNRGKKVKKVSKHSLLGLIFGWTGKLASRNSKRQKKRFVITILSLTLSFAIFAGASCVIDVYSDSMNAIYGAESGGYDFGIDIKMHTWQPLEFCAPYNKIQSCGLFKDIDMSLWGNSLQMHDCSEIDVISILYLNEQAYNYYFNGKPPVSYDELNQSNKYLLAQYEDYGLHGIDKISGKITERTAQKNQKVSSELPPKVNSVLVDHTFNILDCVVIPKNESEWIFQITEFENTKKSASIIAPIECYIARDHKLYGNTALGNDIFSCNIADGVTYQEAVEYLKGSDEFTIYLDNYNLMENQRSFTAILKLGINVVIVLLILVAIVNMVNIISTGIINRKSELSSLQCIGMTEGQLYRMIFIESVQYTLFAAIAASILCILAIWATKQFLIGVQILSPEYVGELIDYKKPIMKIAAESVFGLIVALLSGIIPLRTMQKDSLVERIRSVE